MYIYICIYTTTVSIAMTTIAAAPTPAPLIADRDVTPDRCNNKRAHTTTENQEGGERMSRADDIADCVAVGFVLCAPMTFAEKRDFFLACHGINQKK